MINIFLIRKWVTLTLLPIIVVICFAIGTIFYNFWIGLMLMACSMLITMIGGNLLLRNPFSNMVEGRGFLAANLDSTGVLRFFNLRIVPPFVKGKFYGENISDVFDRSTVFNIDPNMHSGKMAYSEDGGLEIKLDETAANKAKFMLLHYPLIIWNDQIKSVITKDFLSELEKNAFSEHLVLFLNRKVEELTSVMRDFARYIVENTRPLKGLFSNKTAVIIIVIIVVSLAVLIILFLPKIIATFQGGAASSISNAISAAKDTGELIVPR